MLKRLNTIFRSSGTDSLEAHVTMLEDKMVVPVTTSNLYQNMPQQAINM